MVTRAYLKMPVIKNAVNDVRCPVLLISPPKMQRFMELLNMSNRKMLHMVNACVIAFLTGNNQVIIVNNGVWYTFTGSIHI